jgi:hypothetical protein
MGGHITKGEKVKSIKSLVVEKKLWEKADESRWLILRRYKNMNGRIKVGHQNVSQMQYAVRDAHYSGRCTHKCSNEQLFVAAQPQTHSGTQANYFPPSIIYQHGRGNLAGGRNTSATAGLLVWIPHILLH